MKSGWSVPTGFEENNDQNFLAFIFSNNESLKDHKLTETPNNEISIGDETLNASNISIGPPQVLIQSDLNYTFLVGSGAKCHFQTDLLKPEHCKIKRVQGQKWCIESLAKEKFDHIISFIFHVFIAFCNLLRIRMKRALN